MSHFEDYFPVNKMWLINWRCSNVHFHFLGQITVLRVTVLKIWFFDSRATQLLAKSRNSLIWESILWLTISHYLFLHLSATKTHFKMQTESERAQNIILFFHDSFYSRQQKWLIKVASEILMVFKFGTPPNFFFTKLHLPDFFLLICHFQE